MSEYKPTVEDWQRITARMREHNRRMMDVLNKRIGWDEKRNQPYATTVSEQFDAQSSPPGTDGRPGKH